MSGRIQALAQQLTGKKSIDECSIDELQHMVQRHPYYAPAQFLLLQKLRQAGTPEQAEAQYRKAVLFYHDPLLFEHFISSNRFYVEEIAVDNFPSTEEEIVEDEQVEEAGFRDDVINEEPEISGDPIEDVDVKEDAVTFEESTNDSEATITTNETVTEINGGDFHQPETFVEDSVEEADVAEVALQEVVEATSPVSANSQEELAIPPANEHDEAKTTEELVTPLEAKLNGQETPGNELAFEPFHTVDYFASQGIKITAEEAPKDKLGKQLKSFTEWLKTMKRLPASQITDTAETTAEKKVETLASHSVSESDVVTEAMAEVWLKQGNTAKALDIYNKLSLLNPSKKAYFAAKIENLKLS